MLICERGRGPAPLYGAACFRQPGYGGDTQPEVRRWYKECLTAGPWPPRRSVRSPWPRRTGCCMRSWLRPPSPVQFPHYLDQGTRRGWPARPAPAGAAYGQYDGGRHGASLRELMERMGHTSPRARLIYQHATRQRDEAIAAAMGQVLASVRRKGTTRSRSGTHRARQKETAS